MPVHVHSLLLCRRSLRFRVHCVLSLPAGCFRASSVVRAARVAPPVQAFSPSCAWLFVTQSKLDEASFAAQPDCSSSCLLSFCFAAVCVGSMTFCIIFTMHLLTHPRVRFASHLTSAAPPACSAPSDAALHLPRAWLVFPLGYGFRPQHVSALTQARLSPACRSSWPRRLRSSWRARPPTRSVSCLHFLPSTVCGVSAFLGRLCSVLSSKLRVRAWCATVS